MKKLVLAILALALVAFAVALATAPAAAATTYATVTGYEPFSSDANHESHWPGDCQKVDEKVEGDASYTLVESYALVIVKAGAGQYANTLFAGASAGETVWADTNGDGVFNADDKDISHIIFCDEQPDQTPEPTPIITPQPTPEPTPTPTATPEVTPSPTPTPTPEPTPESTPTVTPSPTPQSSFTPTPTPPTETPSPTPPPSVAPSPSPLVTPTPPPSVIPSVSPTPVPPVETANPTPPQTDTEGTWYLQKQSEESRFLVLWFGIVFAASLLIGVRRLATKRIRR